jgi:hypothetical protein
VLMKPPGFTEVPRWTPDGPEGDATRPRDAPRTTRRALETRPATGAGSARQPSRPG